ncbi:MAG: 3-phosphoshikimate 1-carboxyvinyltransferase [Eubacteriales bacterium]|nr:3-phosphoshikimate 1-carboxyvinyltransferase [Eubacteriales bacterium]
MGVQMLKIGGEIRAVSSKSDVHRLIIASALCDRAVKIGVNGISEDILATTGCIGALGGEVKVENGQNGFENTITVNPISVSNGCPELDFRESGTTARLLVPVSAALFGRVKYSGSGRLPERPFTQLFSAMEENGCSFSSHKLPATHKGKLKSGVFELDGNISSQYISGLLFALPMLDGDSEIRLRTKLESAAYVDMTLNTLSFFGIKIEKTDYGFFVEGRQRYISPSDFIAADGDWSNGAFWLAAGIASETGVTVTGLDTSSAQGDKAVIEILKRFGAKITTEKGKITVSKGQLHSTVIDAAEIPDLVPILSVVGAVAKGETVIKNASRLRIKESDRLKTTAAMINALGGDVTETQDGLIIKGRENLNGGVCDGAGDHRIVMSAAVASLFCSGKVKILGKEAANKSYPDFFRDFRLLTGGEEF